MTNRQLKLLEDEYRQKDESKVHTTGPPSEESKTESVTRTRTPVEPADAVEANMVDEVDAPFSFPKCRSPQDYLKDANAGAVYDFQVKESPKDSAANQKTTAASPRLPRTLTVQEDGPRAFQSGDNDSGDDTVFWHPRDTSLNGRTSGVVYVGPNGLHMQMAKTKEKCNMSLLELRGLSGVNNSTSSVAFATARTQDSSAKKASGPEKQDRHSAAASAMQKLMRLRFRIQPAGTQSLSKLDKGRLSVNKPAKASARDMEMELRKELKYMSIPEERETRPVAKPKRGKK